MIKTAIEKILSLDQAITTVDIHGAPHSKHKLLRVKAPDEYTPEKLIFNTLRGIVEFAEKLTTLPEIVDDLFFTVSNFSLVDLFGQLQPHNENSRFLYAQCKLNFNSFQFNAWHDLEMFVISLQSLFVQDDNVNAIIDMLGRMANENVVENKDDGFSQTLQIRTGITHREKVTVKNPVTLRPWRTFREVGQPEGKFILRLRTDKHGDSIFKCSLWEADGGMWQMEAVSNIAGLLKDITTIPVIS